MQMVLIDTDVILDNYLQRKPFFESSSRILVLCENKTIEGYVTAVIISNLYFILRKLGKHSEVIAQIKNLLNIVEVATINKSSVLQALDSEFKDFEDALQNFSAQNSDGINIIITRNTKDYKSSKLTVMTPENFLKS